MPKPTLPTLLTKHCTPEVRQYLLEGQFKIGTLREFREAELGTGAFSDSGEGKSAIQIRGDVHNGNFRVGTNTFQNVTAIGCGTAFHVEHQLDANAFCASAGPYNADRHKRLASENPDYKGNPEWTAHVVLNTARLLAAFEALLRALPLAAFIKAGAIQYDVRELEGLAADIPALLNDRRYALHALECIFIKPKRFHIEEEFRIGMIPHQTGGPCETIYTRNHPDLLAVFQAAIEDEGANEL